jgi:hypothetical protein
LSQKIEINIKAIDEASREIDSMARNIDRSLDDVNRSSDEVVRKQKDLERAVDDVSRNAAGDVGKAATEIKKDYDDVNKKSEDVVKHQKSIQDSARNLVTGFSGLATSVFGLYKNFDDLEKKQLSVDKANLAVRTSTNSLEDAEKREKTAADDLAKAKQILTEKIEKYGADSKEAADATDTVNKKLDAYNTAVRDAQTATEKHNLAVETASQKQGDLSNALISTALTAVPQLITAIDSGSKLFKSLEGLRDFDFSKLWDSLSSIGSKISDLASGLTGLGGAAGSAASTAGAITAGAGAAGGGALGVGGAAATAAAGLGIAGIVAGLAIPTALAAAKDPVATFDAIAEMGGKAEEKLDELAASVGEARLAVDAFTTKITPGSLVAGVGGHLQGGGIVTRPMVSWVGEAGPEAVVPLDRVGMGSNVYDIKIVNNIEGSVDERTLRVIEKRLKNVIVEASSSGAGSTSKRIRFGSVFT